MLAQRLFGTQLHRDSSGHSKYWGVAYHLSGVVLAVRHSCPLPDLRQEAPQGSYLGRHLFPGRPTYRGRPLFFGRPRTQGIAHGQSRVDHSPGGARPRGGLHHVCQHRDVLIRADRDQAWPEPMSISPGYGIPHMPLKGANQVSFMPKKKEPPLSAEEQRRRFDELAHEVGAHRRTPEQFKKVVRVTLAISKQPPRSSRHSYVCLSAVSGLEKIPFSSVMGCYPVDSRFTASPLASTAPPNMLSTRGL